MASLNKVQIIGNLGQDPEMRFTANGRAVSTFSVAVNRSYTTGEGERREETEWVRVVAWARLAELVSQYLTKGRLVYVEGRMQTRQWDDKEGQRRYTTEVVAQDIQFLDRGDSPGPDPAIQPIRTIRPRRRRSQRNCRLRPRRRPQRPALRIGHRFPAGAFSPEAPPYESDTKGDPHDHRCQHTRRHPRAGKHPGARRSGDPTGRNTSRLNADARCRGAVRSH